MTIVGEGWMRPPRPTTCCASPYPANGKPRSVNMPEKGPKPAVRRPSSAEDYEVFCGEQIDGAGRFYGLLRIRRKTDGRLIYPFDGCPRPGPCPNGPQARSAALALADELIRADIAMPEA
jgi:hypothetical protein